tara:strand:+ start:38798 stop:39736 length:939 start_codon:yes stop_codon:yes gene_type:complete
MADNNKKKDDKKQNSDEYLKDYLGNNDYNGDGGDISNQHKNQNPNQSLGSAKDLKFLTIDINELPCSYFYPAGTSVLVRAAEVGEIQAFSVVDDTNFYDLFEKVNHIVQSCVMLKFPDGSKKPYTHLIDGDRWYLLFVIRELTFQKGNDLFATVGKTKIPIKRGFFTFHDMDDRIKKYYNKLAGNFTFETKIGNIEMAPPTMGLQKSFTDYMIKEAQAKRDLDESFLKIVPYTFPGRTSITEEGIKKEYTKFKTLPIDLFQFLNQAIDKLSFGISGVKTLDESGMEVHSEEIFPDGISKLFVQPDAFDDFLK